MNLSEIKDKIELSNEGNISVVFLGTGNSFSKEFFNTNILVIKGDDHVLIDCGVLCPLMLFQNGIELSEIKNILITHAHSDHSGGLEELAFYDRYVGKFKPNLIIEDKFKNLLWKNSLKGGLGLCGEENSKQKLNFEDYFNQVKPSKIKTVPRPFFEVRVGSINIKIFRTKHVFNSKNNWKNGMYSVGVLIDDKIIFTGDTKFDRDLIEWLSSDFEIEHIFHDVSMNKNAVHASYEELCSLPEEIKNKTTLCHYSAELTEQDIAKDGFCQLAKVKTYYQF